MDQGKKPSSSEQYERLAREPRPSFLSDLGDFLRQSKRWWLTPIIVVLVLFGLLVALGATGGAPFIYTLF